MASDNAEQSLKTRQSDSPLRLFGLATALLVVSIAAISFDSAWSRFCMTECPNPIREFLALCEVFGHGLGVPLFCAMVWVLDPAGASRAFRILATGWGAGLTANLAKLLVARFRPNHFDLSLNAWQSFDGFLPGLVESARQSMPSAHTATAIGLAVALSRAYPRGRRLFLAMVVLVAFQRMVFGAHYLSDVLAGAAVGLAAAWLIDRGIHGGPWSAQGFHAP